MEAPLWERVALHCYSSYMKQRGGEGSVTFVLSKMDYMLSKFHVIYRNVRHMFWAL